MLVWDTGANTSRHTQVFLKSGAVLVEVEALAAHAIKNAGNRELIILSCTEQPYDPDDPDVHTRQLTS